MSEQPNQPENRLDGLLRRWGADEAVRAARPAAPPPTARGRAHAPAKRRPGERRLPWTAMAAAAILLCALSFWAGSMLPGPRRVSSSAPGDAGELESARKALAQARADAQSARDALKIAETQLADRQKELARLGERENQWAEEKKSLLQGYEDSLAKLRGEGEAKDKALTAAKARAEEAAAQLAKAQQDLVAAEADKKAAADLERLRKEFATETARLRELHGKAVAEARAAGDDLTALKARQSQLFREAQMAYLNVAAPTEAGLQARQTAARRSLLAARCAQLEKLARAEETRKIIARLEVVLTRLDLLDSYDARAEDGFASLVSQDGLLGRIETVLAAGAEPESVRILLLESRLVLTGVNRVG